MNFKGFSLFTLAFAAISGYELVQAFRPLPNQTLDVMIDFKPYQPQLGLCGSQPNFRNSKPALAYGGIGVGMALPMNQMRPGPCEVISMENDLRTGSIIGSSSNCYRTTEADGSAYLFVTVPARDNGQSRRPVRIMLEDTSVQPTKLYESCILFNVVKDPNEPTPPAPVPAPRTADSPLPPPKAKAAVAPQSSANSRQVAQRQIPPRRK